MFKDKNVAFIGCGVMGEAMMRGLIRQEIVTPDHIYAADPLPARLEDLRERYGVHITSSNAEAAEAGVDGELVVDDPPEECESFAEAARARGIDHLHALGPASREAVAAFGAAATHHDDVDGLIAACCSLRGPDTSILVKGSRFMRMARVVQALSGASVDA